MPAIPRFRIRLTDKDLWETREDMRKESEHTLAVVERFEREFASFVRRQYAVFMPSARYSLYRILKYMSFEEGDWVIVPAWTHPSVPSMVIAAGLRPLFADIEGGLYNMTHNTVPKEYWKKAKAMIMTHMYGCPTTVYELLELADRHRVKVIEDCCQSAGAAVFGKMVGSVGYAAIFSTGYTKNLPTLTGGFAVTDDQILANHLKDSRSSHFNPVQELKRSMRSCFYINHFTAPYMYNNLTHFLSSMGIAVGWDFVHEWHKEPVITPTPRIKPPTPHPVQAMLGMKMLATLDHFNKSVAANAEMLLDQIKGIRGVIMPRVTRGHQHIYTGFVLMVDKPWEVKKALMTRGIDTAPGYIMNCAAAPEFSEFNVKCVIAERLQAMRIHIPCYESLYKDQIDDMARAIVHICGR